MPEVSAVKSLLAALSGEELPPQAALAAGELALRLGETERAAGFLEQVLRRDPAHPEAARKLSCLLDAAPRPRLQRNRDRELVLHAGARKTGSSYLQSFFARNLAALEGACIRYPALENLKAAAEGAITSGNAGAFSHTLLNWSPKERYSQEMVDMLWCRFEKALRTNPHPRLLLSSEFFFECPRESLVRIREACDQQGYRCKALIYLRRQDQYVQAMYAQEVKRSHATEGAEAFCRRALETDPRLRYRERLEVFAEVFGADRCVVRPYERSQIKGGDLLQDMLDFLGLPSDGEYALPEKAINPTPSAEELQFFLAVNADRPSREVSDWILDLFVRSAPPDRFRPLSLIPPDLQREILGRFEEENAWVARRLLGREDGILFRDPLPEPGASWEAGGPLTAQSMARIFGALLADLIEERHKTEKTLTELTREMASLKGASAEGGARLAGVATL
jgi:tetratricopeptide (TPR) repeat protein